MHNKYKINRISLLIVLILVFLAITTYFSLKYIKSRGLEKGEEVISDIVGEDTVTEDNKEDDGLEETNNSNKPDNSNTKKSEYDDIIITRRFIYNFSKEVAADVNAVGMDQIDIPRKYVYGEKVPESKAVSNDYFDDAVFIGNSQMEGVAIYSSMKNVTVLAGKGIMVDTIFTKEVIKTKDGNRITIMSALEQKEYGKIYIMLGANELGWASDTEFIKQYGKVIDKLKELQPKAKIYVNSIIPVSKKKSETDNIYNNINIERFNKLILEMTKEKEVYYLDSKEALGDDEGNLPADSTTDGVHFNAPYYEKWFNYLKTHTVKVYN